MRVMGIDPGIGTIGFGLLEVPDIGGLDDSHGARHQWGTITTSKDKPDGLRLQEIERDLTEVIAALKPDVIAWERLFYFRNVTTMVPVCQARGVILLVMSRYDAPIYEYTPMQVKQAITGYGKAQKAEIQVALMDVLGLEKKPRPDDAADALAVAYCHYAHVGRMGTPQSATVV